MLQQNVGDVDSKRRALRRAKAAARDAVRMAFTEIRTDCADAT
jgi:hypothetical protein